MSAELEHAGPEISRRTLLRAGGAAAGVAVGAEAGLSGPASAQLSPTNPDLFAFGLPISEVMAGVSDFLYGSSSNVSEINFDEHLNIYTDHRALAKLDLGDGQNGRGQIAAFLNYSSLMDTPAMEEAWRAVFAAAEQGKTESAAIADAKQAAREQLAIAERQLMNHWERHMTVIQTALDRRDTLVSNASTTKTDVLFFWDETAQSKVGTVTGSEWGASWSERTMTLVDGSNVTITTTRKDASGNWTIFSPDASTSRVQEVIAYRDGETTGSWTNLITQVRALPPEFADYSVSSSDYGEETKSMIDNGEVRWDAVPYGRAHKAILDHETKVISDLETAIPEKYAAIQDGKWSYSEFVSPAGLLDTAKSADSAAEAALQFRYSAMARAVEPATIDFAPNQDGGKFTTILAATDTVDPLPVGEQIDPAQYPGISFEAAIQYVPEGSDSMTGEVRSVSAPFVIQSTKSGADSLVLERRKVIESGLNPSDIAKILEEHNQAEQDAQAATVVVNSGWSGLGGLFSGGGGIGALAILAGAGAFLVALLK